MAFSPVRHTPLPYYKDSSTPNELPHVPVADATDAHQWAVDAEPLILTRPLDACTACQIWAAHAHNCALCRRDQFEGVQVNPLRTTEDDFTPDLVACLNDEGWILAMLNKLQDIEADNSKLKGDLETALNKRDAFDKQLRCANEEICWAEDEIARLKEALFVAQSPSEPQGLTRPPMAALPPQAHEAAEPTLPMDADLPHQPHVGAHRNSRGEGEPLSRSDSKEEHNTVGRRPKRKRIDEGERKPKARRLLVERGHHRASV